MCAAPSHGMEGNTRRRLLVRGVVQGVGFRPYVYQLARSCVLAGFVRNTANGAVIELEGPVDALDDFSRRLPCEGPPLMRVSTIESLDLPPMGVEDGFLILDSEASEDAFALVPPDTSVCDECLADTKDPKNRRFEYPFTNCTNCGPRYSIIVDVPYDRAQTTMREFAMCADCRREYDDPGDRRFHAQPNACPVCGPRMRLLVEGRELRQGASAREVLVEVARALAAGKIVAWKGLGGYQLACDARHAHAVRELRRRKHRNEKPFAIMVKDVEAARRLCIMSEAESLVLTSPERPIVLLVRKSDTALAPEIACGNPDTGVMLPYTPMHELLFRVLEQQGNEMPLVMTSGNRSEEPIATDDDEALRSLGDIADVFVPHNRRIHTRVDDSVVRVVEERTLLVRRARGYAPQPLWLGRGDAQVLACGAQQKNTLCLTKDGFGLFSQHLGDLENYETVQFFEETLERMKRLFHVHPSVVACDLHPGYLSTQLAMKMLAERHVGVQHHHAHIAACMAEHGLSGDVIGVAWDGTGLGTDGTIWGGEFLVADFAAFKRVAALRNVLLAGGDAAVREPWRVARAYLLDTYADPVAFDSVVKRRIACSPSPSEASVRVVDAMLQRQIQTIESSSCGRLFDAVAALIGLRQTVSFEGQAAMALEAVAAAGLQEAYDFAVERPATVGHLQVDMRPMIRKIVDDVQRGVTPDVISARFHGTLVAAVVQVCCMIRAEFGLQRVCLSGGCFQNVLLLRGCLEALRPHGFDVFYPQRVPANDGGISLGQAAIACELVRQGV